MQFVFAFIVGGGDGSRAGWFGRVSFSVLPVFVRFSVLLHPFLRYSVLR